MTQPAVETTKLADKNGVGQIGTQGAAIADLAITYTTDDPGVTPNSAIVIADGDGTLVTAEVMIAVEELVAKTNAVLAALRAHGLIAD